MRFLAYRYSSVHFIGTDILKYNDLAHFKHCKAAQEASVLPLHTDETERRIQRTQYERQAASKFLGGTVDKIPNRKNTPRDHKIISFGNKIKVKRAEMELAGE